jgi:transcriptional regulator with XRE-family HTH domain
MSRLHQRNAELALGGPFMAALSDVGLQADRSAVSRWESGKMQPRYSVLTAYERVLELPQGQLTTVVNALRRAYAPEGQRAWTPVLDPQSDAFHLRLDYLLDVLRSDQATGPDWTEFGYYVSAPDMLYLHGSVWHELAYRLIDEMARSVGLAYLQRYETIRMLLEHRVAASWLLRAVGDYLSDPAVQIVNEPVGVLEISPSPEATAALLEKFAQTESEAVFDATVAAIAYKVGAGQFSATDLDRIEATLMRAMRRRTREMAGLEEILVVMPESAQARLMEASRGLRGHQDLATVAAHGEWIRPDVAKRVAQQIADEVRGHFPSATLYDEDPMTPRIIREALFSARSGQRHLSSLALLGSPFRGPLAAALAEQIEDRDWEEPILYRFVHLLRYLVGPEQEDLLLGWVPKVDLTMLCDVALALGHLPPSQADLEPLVARLGESYRTDRAILYALGMRRNAALPILAKDDARPPAIRDAAAWWLRQGGAVLE